MDAKAIFVKTSKGEEEMLSQNSHLPGDLRRSLVMVDGDATFGEISKRAAPSLRSNLEELFKELLQSGFIQEKSKLGNSPNAAFAVKMSMPAKMVVPSKTPVIEEEDVGLDFASVLRAQPEAVQPIKISQAESDAVKKAQALAQEKMHAAQVKQAADAQAQTLLKAKARLEEEAKDRAAIEIQARALEEARARAEDEARARSGDQVKLESEARARAEDEAEAQVRALAKAKLEAEAKIRVEAETKARIAAEAKARAEELARLAAEAKTRAEAQARLAVEAKARAEAELLARELAEAKAKLEAETKARAEEQARLAAEAKARAEAELLARELAAAKAKLEAEARARAKEEARLAAEVKARFEAELLARELAKAKVRLELEMEAAARAKEQARLAAEVKARAEAELQASESAQANLLMEPVNLDVLEVAVNLRSGQFPLSRTISATVLFIDIVGYTKQPVHQQIEVKNQFNQLLSLCLHAHEEKERIILDTGDGAAIGFMQHPEDAMEVALQFRQLVTANQHQDYPDVQVRIGIHLGPINIVKDMNGQSNMVGDGINDAQRVMSFAGVGQIYVSRPYYDFMSRLSSEYDNQFNYLGSLQDKHGREHPVYELIDLVTSVVKPAPPQGELVTGEVKFEPFTLPSAEFSAATMTAKTRLGEPGVYAELMNEVGKQIQPETKGKSAKKVTQENHAKAAAAPGLGEQTIPQVKPLETHQPSGETPSHSTRLSKNDNQVAGYAQEMKRIEAAQARVWAEAEQRAKEAAKSQVVFDVEPAPQPQISAGKHAAKARIKRKPLPWLKMFAGLMVVVLMVLFVAPMVVSTREYVPQLQRMLSNKLQQPVYIGRLEGRLLPTPRLDLIDMSIGDAKQIKMGLARVNFALPTIFNEVKAIDSLELQGVQVNGAALQQVSAWLQKGAADAEYPISRILLSDAKLEAVGFDLSGVGGEINFNQSGKFSLAKLNAAGNKYTLDLTATLGSKTRVIFTVRDSALPLLPNWVFDELSAKGDLSENELVISEMESRIQGGTLRGNVRMGWRAGWRTQGALVAQAVNLQNILKSLSGNVDGTAQFKMNAIDLATLTDETTLEGAFAIKEGVVNGIDIVETARLRRTENMPGGRTYFDEFRGDLRYENGVYSFRQLRMKGGVLTAKGTANYAEQEVKGSIIADLALSEEMPPIALQLGGTKDNPTLFAVRK